MFANGQIYLLQSNRVYAPEERCHLMTDREETVRFLKALADRSRLQILDCIRKEVANPGDMARKLGRHRSTVEKHLRVLLNAGIVEKVPSLSRAGQLSVRYKIRDSATELLKAILDASREV